MGGVLLWYDVWYVSQLLGDVLGLLVWILGCVILVVWMLFVDVYIVSGMVIVPICVIFVLFNVFIVVCVGDFEVVMMYGIGLVKCEFFVVCTLYYFDWLVVDV